MKVRDSAFDDEIEITGRAKNLHRDEQREEDEQDAEVDGAKRSSRRDAVRKKKHRRECGGAQKKNVFA